MTRDIEIFRRQARMISQTVKTNLQGITHEESLIQPQPGGNRINWVLGHLLNVYNRALPLLGQDPVMDEAPLKKYERGSPPLLDPGQAIPFEQLRASWDEAVKRVDAGLENMSDELLDRPAPPGIPTEPGDTVRSVLSVLLFHQAYHAGQTAVLRRLTGREGAIK
ncbi:MAG: DinB family protein [Gemmatimonadota bacterium]